MEIAAADEPHRSVTLPHIIETNIPQLQSHDTPVRPRILGARSPERKCIMLMPIMRYANIEKIGLNLQRLPMTPSGVLGGDFHCVFEGRLFCDPAPLERRAR